LKILGQKNNRASKGFTELKHTISNQQNVPYIEGKQEALIIKIFNKLKILDIVILISAAQIIVAHVSACSVNVKIAGYHYCQSRYACASLLEVTENHLP